MRYRLIKSEPSVYSRDTFLREKKTVRDAVRSYEARNNLQAMKHADDIIVLAEGKVIERGTHQELVTQGGHYAKMLELQS